MAPGRPCCVHHLPLKGTGVKNRHDCKNTCGEGAASTVAGLKSSPQRRWDGYLDENLELWVALHLSACKLLTVFLFPAVMLVAGEALRELQTEKKRCVNELLWGLKGDGFNLVHSLSR